MTSYTSTYNWDFLLGVPTTPYRLANRASVTVGGGNGGLYGFADADGNATGYITYQGSGSTTLDVVNMQAGNIQLGTSGREGDVKIDKDGNLIAAQDVQAPTFNGFATSQTPAAKQIPVLTNAGNLYIPSGSAVLGGGATTLGAVQVLSGSVAIASNQDVLIGYNDTWSGTVTVTYIGTGRLSIKSWTYSNSAGTAAAGDFLKLRSFYVGSNCLGTPYTKFLSAGGATPHLFIPVTNAVSDGVLTVVFISDIGHHPFFLPAAPAGTLGATAYPLTGL